jgi:hypothetical protein
MGGSVPLLLTSRCGPTAVYLWPLVDLASGHHLTRCDYIDCPRLAFTPDDGDDESRRKERQKGRDRKTKDEKR